MINQNPFADSFLLKIDLQLDATYLTGVSKTTNPAYISRYHAQAKSQYTFDVRIAECFPRTRI